MFLCFASFWCTTHCPGNVFSVWKIFYSIIKSFDITYVQCESGRNFRLDDLGAWTPVLKRKGLFHWLRCFSQTMLYVVLACFHFKLKYDNCLFCVLFWDLLYIKKIVFCDANSCISYVFLVSSFCFQFRESRFAIKDYHLHCLKLRVASHNLWKSSTPRTDLHGFLLSAARALFQQVSNFPCIGDTLLVLGVIIWFCF